MRKVLWLSLIVSAALMGAERVELYGQSAQMDGSLSRLSGDPVAVYQDQVLSADELAYDRNASIIEAKGSVNLFKAQKYRIMSDYYRIGLEDESHYAKPYYLFDRESGAWMSADEAEGCKNEIDLASGAMSGCDSSDPLWKIRFSSADYNSDAMWVNLYNARVVLGEVPVFYLPYFGYPTDKTRRSGLLIPSLGLSSAEGFFYLQPIYVAPQHWWDLELRPQIRTSRGAGIYADLRFVDTPSSEGTIRTGFFKEEGNYARERHLANLQHYGYGLHYEHKAPLREWFHAKTEGESGLYVDGLWMNDVDFKNLQHTNQILNITSKQVISRINGYYNSEKNYFGTYVKHYQYLDKPSNAQTIQTLPSLHYHRYLESFLDDTLLINADAMATNFYREDGRNALQGDFSVPLTFQTSLLDGYADVSYTANASSKAIGFYASPRSDETLGTYDNGFYAQLDHTLALSSTLVRPYGSTTHVLSPFMSYTSAGNRFYSGYYKTYHDAQTCIPGTTNPACDFYTLKEPSDTFAVGVNNYFFDNGKRVLIDRLSQNFRNDRQGSYYEELQNELEWEITSALSVYNQTAYNPERNRITKEQNTLRYNDGTVTASVNHYYTDVLRDNVATYASYWTADAAYQINPDFRLFGLVAYDSREDLFKRKEIGFLHTRRCLDFGLRYVQNRRPVLTNANIASVDESYLFITLILKPIGGSEFNYKLTKN